MILDQKWENRDNWYIEIVRLLKYAKKKNPKQMAAQTAQFKLS